MIKNEIINDFIFDLDVKMSSKSKKQKLVEKTNKFINLFPLFNPKEYNIISNNYYNNKIIKYIKDNKYIILNINCFSSHIENMLITNYYYGRNAVFIVYDEINKIKKILIYRANNENILEFNETLKLDIVKAVFNTFVINGILPCDYMKMVKISLKKFNKNSPIYCKKVKTDGSIFEVFKIYNVKYDYKISKFTVNYKSINFNGNSINLSQLLFREFKNMNDFINMFNFNLIIEKETLNDILQSWAQDINNKLKNVTEKIFSL